MAKANKNTEKEVKQEKPKNPQKYSYRGDEQITIPASLFLMLFRANDAALQQGTNGSFPTALEWVNASTGMTVVKPKEEDIKQGKVIQVMSVEKTFSGENYVESFEPWLFPDIIQAKDRMINIHSENVAAGNAVLIEDLEKEREERIKAEAKMREELEKEAEEKQS